MDDAFRPSKIPTTEGALGGHGQSSVSVKQSRFGVQGNLPIGETLGPLNFRFEFDFFGVGVDAGQTTIRLRHVYREWRSILAGQTNSVFMDGDTGWGVNLSGHLNLFQRDRLLGQIVHGDGIASHMNDAGVDLAPGGTLADPEAEAVPLTGWLIYYDRYWSDRWSTSFGYSVTQVSNRSLQGPTAFHKASTPPSICSIRPRRSF